MKLTPREKDKLMVSMAAIVARKRLDRGIKLNYPEAIALITDFVIEGARDGKMVSELMESGANVVKKENCMDGVADMISGSLDGNGSAVAVEAVCGSVG